MDAISNIERSGEILRDEIKTSMVALPTYVTRRKFTIPAGLNGGHAVNFVIPKGVDAPEGNPGHCILLNRNVSPVLQGALAGR